MNTQNNTTLLNVSQLSINFASDHGVVQAVKSLSLSIERGQTFALVGESGSGKSVTALALLRLLPDAAYIQSGSIAMGNEQLLQLPEKQMRSVRGARIGIVFQEPATSMNPVLTVGQQLQEVLRLHTKLRGVELLQKTQWWLERVGIPDAQKRINDYPFQFSGGQKQRIMIAIALAAQPDILVADEPTTALDVTVQAQILDLLADIQRDTGLAILLITHDLAVVRQVADYVALMRHGKILLTQRVDDFFSAPAHEYAIQLLEAVPNLDKRGYALSGQRVNNGSAMPASPSSNSKSENKAILSVQNLSVAYTRSAGLFARKRHQIPVLQNISFNLNQGETLALLGESGCGKTTVAKTLMRLHDSQVVVNGTVKLDDINVLNARGSTLKHLRRSMQIVFQDPYASLDPRMQVGEILNEGLKALKPEMSAQQRTMLLNGLLDRVGLPANTINRYPHEFSGGQRQRIAIARALALEPKVLICDEPTSALDVSVQAQLLDLLRDLQAELNIAYLFITHNFGVVEYLSDRIVILDQGHIVESGDTLAILSNPQHNQTKRLLAAVPRL